MSKVSSPGLAKQTSKQAGQEHIIKYLEIIES